MDFSSTDEYRYVSCEALLPQLPHSEHPLRILTVKDENYSIQDILLILSRIKVYSVGGEDTMSKISKDARELVSERKIDVDVLRKY